MLLIASLALIAFAALGSESPDSVHTTPSQLPRSSKGSPFPEDIVHYGNAFMPVLVIAAILVAIKMDKMPPNVENAVRRVFHSDLVVLFLIVAYGHYVINVEDSHTDTNERYFDAMLRVGALVTAWWVMRQVLAQRSQGGARLSGTHTSHPQGFGVYPST